MRTEEEFVLGSVAKLYSGEWKPGENPPDGDLTVAGRTIAVEVSTLTQHITDDKGTRPRLSDDTAAIRLANELDAELRGGIPINKLVILVLRAPINEYRKTKVLLRNEINSLLSVTQASNRAERKVSIRGNEVEIYLDEAEGGETKKIVAAVMNRSSSPDILKNVLYMLEDRISVKARKCANVRGPIWLALQNDYFLTDVDTYRYGLQFISVEHPFEKILLVSGDASVATLFELDNAAV